MPFVELLILLLFTDTDTLLPCRNRKLFKDNSLNKVSESDGGLLEIEECVDQLKSGEFHTEKNNGPDIVFYMLAGVPEK